MITLEEAQELRSILESVTDRISQIEQLDIEWDLLMRAQTISRHVERGVMEEHARQLNV